MSNADLANKFNSLIARAAGYVANPGPAGEVQQRAKAVIADHMVEVVIRDSEVHHFTVEAIGGAITFAKTQDEAVAAVAA